MRERVHNDEKRFSARAESVEIESDEDGWELRITDDDGHLIVVNVHAVSRMLAREARKIDRYWEEGAALAASHVVNGDGYETEASHVVNGDGYETDDPKHPGYADLMAEARQ